MLKITNGSIILDGKTILKDINLNLDNNITTLFGLSGSGKTTLLKAISGLNTLDSGEIFLNNINISNIRTEDRNIGMVFQDFLLFPHMTIEENLKIASKDSVLLNKLIKNLRIENLLDNYPGTLSGGEQQRVAIIRTIVMKPNIILLDEPFNNIDHYTKSILIRDLKKTFSELNIPVIITTHNFQDAFHISKDVIILQEGEILQSGNILNVYDNPNSIEIARLLGEANVIPLPTKKGKRCKNLFFRPESITLDSKKISNYPFSGIIKDIIIFPTYKELKVLIGNNVTVIIYIGLDIIIFKGKKINFHVNKYKLF